ncbi:glycosyltransferase [Flavobacterium geliluteum]|uniref:Glycosyltransferase family 4 protein n=1 Tax=Flavobacterium geliluteum TaxID=2816120 RepID=A0A940X6I3_9FLAO|nr:glycosyltransferase [Flavobacterium geliluteum]MBP4137629.1 glycosyltransferase family 4 protein [Flavobacterium geliluteum]
MYKSLKLYFRLILLTRRLKKEKKYSSFTSNLKFDSYVLIVDTKVPEYNKDSGSRRLTEIIKLLITNKVGVFLLADFKELKFRTEYVQYFKDLGVVVYEPSLDASGKLITKNKFIELILPNVNFAWLHRPEIFEKYYPIVNKNKPLIKIFFDMVDFHYLRFKREAELTGDTEIMKIANKYLNLELDNCQKADKIIVISDFEKQNLKGYYSDEDKMIAIGNIHQFIKNDASKCFQDRKDLLFIGGFEHKPNVDAVHYLHNEIMPLLWNTDPEIAINIIGSNVSKEILALHSEKFKILGYVEDVSAYFLESRVFVAPLRYGAGIKGKIGQSLEFGLPLVTTKIGAEGFDFKENTNWIVADKKEEIVKNILEIYKDETLWNKISSDSEMVIEPFSNNTIEKKIISLVR